MKKTLIILICLVGICAQGWAQKSGPIEGAILGCVIRETLVKETQITRNQKDFRILYFLGKEYKMHYGSPVVMTYFNADREGIAIGKYKGTLERNLWNGIEFLEQTGYTRKSHDERNPNDIIYSAYKEEGDEIIYKVVRLFSLEDDEFLRVVVTQKISQKDPLPLMRKVMQGVRATPQEVLSAHFPEGSCEFGEDCY